MCCPHLCRACTSTHVTLGNLILFSPLSWYESFLLRLMDEKELSGILGTPENSKRWLHSLIFTVLNGQPVQDSAHQLRYGYVTPIPCDVFPTCTSSWPPLHRQPPASFPSLKGNSCLLRAIECIGERYWKIFGKDDPPPLWSCSSWRDSTGNHPRKPCDHSFFMPLNHQALPNEWPPWTYGQKEFLKVPCAWIFFWRSHVCSTRKLF